MITDAVHTDKVFGKLSHCVEQIEQIHTIDDVNTTRIIELPSVWRQ